MSSPHDDSDGEDSRNPPTTPAEIDAREERRKGRAARNAARAAAQAHDVFVSTF